MKVMRYVIGRPRPHVSVFVWQPFRCGYGFRPHVSDENGNRKLNLLKRLSRVEFFENAVFVFPCGRGKTELFENYDVSVLDLAHPRERKWQDTVILCFFFAKSDKEIC